MKPTDIDALLEKMLAEPEQPIQDNGFTNAVTKALPAVQAVSNRLRSLIIVAAAAVAAGIALFVCGDGRAFVSALCDVLVSPARMQLPQISSIAIIALSVWGVIAALQTDAETVS
jgi:hypothetical protein